MRSEKEEILKQAIAELIAQAGLTSDEIVYEEGHGGRHVWTRKVGKCYRYMQMMALEDTEFPGIYTILWGRYSKGDQSAMCDEFDARSYGRLDYVLVFFQYWLIDLKEWTEPLGMLPPIL